ncbi:MAG: tRNA epoxyqueuosine(34) reductase QueG [Polyangiaceae bacterium]
MSGSGVSFRDHGAAPPRAPTLEERVRAEARKLGFDAVGIARADVSLDRDMARYEAFIAAGMQGEMTFLARHGDARARLDRASILPGARSVVCLARRYERPTQDEGRDSATAKGIARYARGRDYHGFLRNRIRRLATFLRSLGTPEEPVRARPLCDEEPVLERAWAARAGLGFVGKNGMVIVPGGGSMMLLGEVVTTLVLDPGEPIAERCGSCTRCLDACPTGAFAAPFVLDPRLCISYLTIELKTPIPVELREAVGTHLFGCDDCQTACPFNAGTNARAPLPRDDGDPFVPLDRWSRVGIEALLTLDDVAWRALSEGTPLKRAGRAGLARNAAMVLGNRGDPAALPALRLAATQHADAIVRDAAVWAVTRLETRT